MDNVNKKQNSSILHEYGHQPHTDPKDSQLFDGVLSLPNALSKDIQRRPMYDQHSLPVPPLYLQNGNQHLCYAPPMHNQHPDFVNHVNVLYPGYGHFMYSQPSWYANFVQPMQDQTPDHVYNEQSNAKPVNSLAIDSERVNTHAINLIPGPDHYYPQHGNTIDSERVNSHAINFTLSSEQSNPLDNNTSTEAQGDTNSSHKSMKQGREMADIDEKKQEPKCAEVFNFSHSNDDHMTKVHPELEADKVQTLQCDVDGCTKTFQTEALLQQHSSRSHKKTNIQTVINGGFQCEVCGIVIAHRSRTHLERHMDIHKSEAAHKCEFCNKPFWHIATLRSHYRHCPKIPEDTRKKIGKKYKRKPKQLKCTYCPKTFADNRNFR